ncbi:hypothetical protein D9619_004703 [Psilocybe cf. subviscida]|uniref:DUF202 domain-containing protein n=1 Tax=Psilocybe cf. subviscida TaxID=2480587 RepID=A0A8H5BQ70_9AGAR|nr:hypothetical protein D9619_004703 [Psilocybe cf. subviscida]
MSRRPSFLSRYVFPTHSGTLQEAQDEAQYLSPAPHRDPPAEASDLQGPSSLPDNRISHTSSSKKRSHADGSRVANSPNSPSMSGHSSSDTSSTHSHSGQSTPTRDMPIDAESGLQPQQPPQASSSSLTPEGKPRRKKIKQSSTKTALYQHRVHGVRLNRQLLHAVRHFRPNLVLENAGSVARDHLASERTFLAYVRTSIAIASTGVALVQLFTIADITAKITGTDVTPVTRSVQRFAKPLGITCVVLGLITLSIGIYRYFLIQVALPENHFPVARTSMAFIAFAISAVVVVIFAALVSGRP